MDLLITVGPPGSGKSTWADRNLDKSVLRLERDRFRECVFGSRRDYHDSNNPRKSKMITTMMKQAMDDWHNEVVAVTDTGLFYNSVRPFLRKASKTCLIIFCNSREILESRNQSRDESQRVPSSILQDMIEEFNKTSAWWRKSEFNKYFVDGSNFSLLNSKDWIIE